MLSRSKGREGANGGGEEEEKGKVVTMVVTKKGKAEVTSIDARIPGPVVPLYKGPILR